MIKNYLTTAIRNLFKHKTFSFINVLGLSAGLTCCLLIFVFVGDEFNYDKFHGKKDRIFRVHYMLQDFNIGSVPPVFAGHVQSYFPEVEKVARMYNRGVSVQVKQPDESIDRYEETNVFFADSSIVDIFSFQPIEGSIREALSTPFSLVINKEIAAKYFGTKSAVGQLITLEGSHSFKVGAVVEDFPSNSHLHFNILVPYNNMYDIEPSSLSAIIRSNYKVNWMVSHSMTYVLLKPGTYPSAVDQRFSDFVAEKIPEQMQRGQSFRLQPLLDIHLNSEIRAQADPTGSMTFIYIFIAIGSLTLLIASINFINLSTARSLQRTKEIGVRKVLGAWKSNLIAQFLGESFVTTGVAMVLAIGATVLLIPQLNDLTGKVLSASALISPIALMGITGLFVLTGLLAGLYPAFFVTRISPVYSIKGQLNQKGGGLSFRKVLIIVQFTISMVLISSTFIVFDQLDLLRNKPLGFQKEYMINVPIQSQNLNSFFGGIDGEMRQKMNSFEDRLTSIPGVLGSTVSAGAPGLGIVNRNIIPEGFTAEDNMIAPVYSVDYDFNTTYGIKLIEGRDFSKDFGTDHLNAYIINEHAVQEYRFGSTQEAIGKNINVEGKEGKIIGVVDDFNFVPLNNPMGPLVMHVSASSFSTFSIKIDSQNIPKTLTEIESVWNSFFPNETFANTFLDDQIDQAYVTQQQLGDIVSYFSVLAIIISCLGSYGLIMFIAQQKMKEVGIRKVLGASIYQLVLLISKRFVGLAILATFISVPLGILAADYWLDNFSYRVDISPVSFFIASGITIGMVLVTISYQSIKTAIANPVKALRNE